MAQTVGVRCVSVTGPLFAFGRIRPVRHFTWRRSSQSDVASLWQLGLEVFIDNPFDDAVEGTHPLDLFSALSSNVRAVCVLLRGAAFLGLRNPRSVGAVEGGMARHPEAPLHHDRHACAAAAHSLGAYFDDGHATSFGTSLGDAPSFNLPDRGTRRVALLVGSEEGHSRATFVCLYPGSAARLPLDQKVDA